MLFFQESGVNLDIHQLISTLGFPIFSAVAMGLALWKSIGFLASHIFIPIRDRLMNHMDHMDKEISKIREESTNLKIEIRTLYDAIPPYCKGDILGPIKPEKPTQPKGV